MRRKPVLSLVIALLMLLGALPTEVYAASDTINLATIPSGFTVSLSPGATNTFTIIDSDPQVRTNIRITCAAGLNIILDGVSIDNSGSSGACPLSFTGAGNTLTLAPGKENTLKGGADSPGIEVSDGESLAVCGTGTLNVYGGDNAAGIGSGYDSGAGTGAASGQITITDGDVHAYGGENAAAIGGGYQGACNTLGISGSANVSATGGSCGAGLGSGKSAANNSAVITINNGIVNATGGDGAAGIGGGDTCGGGTIRLGGGSVTALGGATGAGIGNGESADGSSVTDISVSGGIVSATGGTDAGNIGGAGIGGSYKAAGCTVNITGGNVSAQGGYGGAGIGGGYQGATGIIMISNATVNAEGGRKGPGIGGLGPSGSITIKSGSVTAAAGSAGGFGGAAGIGGAIGGSIPGEYGTCSILIEGGTVIAAGSSEYVEGGGAGIGGGDYCQSSEITITGGNVTATGGGLDTFGGGSGIGSGYGGKTKTITISGGTVNATGADGNPGIGGSPYDSGSEIVISDGAVFAEKGAGAQYDIGGANVGENILRVYGRARVFFRNDKYAVPLATTSHLHRASDPSFSGDSFCGIPVAWHGSFGAFLRPYTLSYDLNGGSGVIPPPAEQHIDTTTVISGGDGLAKARCVFAGWNTRADGGGKAYAANGTYTFTANATLYAQWAPYAYTVAYDSNGGSGSMNPSAHAYGVAQALNANAFTRTGYTFAGWARDAGGAVELKDGESVLNLTSVNGSTVTLYAKWTVNTYAVVYDKNGGTGGATPSSAHIYGIAITLSKNGYIKTGYTFMGWAKSPGGTPAYADGASVTSLTEENGDTVTLYAVWASSGQYAIRISANDKKYGTVTGGGSFGGGDTVTLTATPAKGYRLQKWTEGRLTVSASPVYMFTAAQTRTLKATFVKIDAPKLRTCTVAGYDRIRISWSAVPGASGYHVFRKSGGKYVQVADVTGVLSYTDTGLSTGVKYAYKVRAYCVSGDKVTTGPYSGVRSEKPVLAKASGLALAKAEQGVNVSFAAVPGATVYEIWRSARKSSVFKLVASVTDTVYCDAGPAAGKPYYYKVRAYRLVNGRKAYGDYSLVKSIKP